MAKKRILNNEGFNKYLLLLIKVRLLMIGFGDASQPQQVDINK